MRKITAYSLSGAIAATLFSFATLSPAQITSAIQATIHHQFTVGEATLPPGRYTFRTVPDSQAELMTVSNEDGTVSDEFLVRRSLDPHIPKHSVLVFREFGNREFLAHIYQVGTKDGVTVVEPSREESRLEKQGQNPVEHREEQAQ